MIKIKAMIKRLKSPTPSFWKKVRTFGMSIVGAGVATLAFKSQMPELHAMVFTIANYMIVVGTAIAALAQATKTGE